MSGKSENTEQADDIWKIIGVRFGRPRKLNSEQEQLAQRLIGEGKPISEIAKTFNVHTATIYWLSTSQS